MRAAYLFAILLLFCSAQAAVSSPHQAQSLYGVTIGENAAFALRALGLAPPRWKAPQAGAPVPQAEYRFVRADYGKALLALVMDTRIKSITIQRYGTNQPDIIDPYGIGVNDSVARLIAKRGQPDTTNSRHDYIYGSRTGVHWVYETRSGRVTSIAVSDRGTY
jgi:hypothetical protein